MLRRIWEISQRLGDPLVVGAAVTLIGLSCLGPASIDGSGQADVAAVEAVQESPPPVARDAAYYRRQWALEAAEYYRMNPPLADDASRSPAVAVAVGVEPPVGPVQQASHIAGAESPAKAAAEFSSKPLRVEATAANARVGRWQVISCLAAGLLASLLFSICWPWRPAAAAGLQPEPALDDDQEIELRLPARWILRRPRTGECCRDLVISSSYALASIAALRVWMGG